jgi:ketosteroid isomerase-like protein
MRGFKMMTDLDRLIAIEEIKQLKARYFRCMDTKDWAGLEAVFAPDAEFDMRGEAADKSKAAEGVVFGAANIATFIRNAVIDLLTVHHGHMPEIDVTSPTTAKGVWAMEDILRWPDGGPVKTLQGYGHYHETYRKVDGAWRIQSSRLSRLRVDIT